MNRLQRTNPKFELLLKRLAEIGARNGKPIKELSFPKIQERIATNSEVVKILIDEFEKNICGESIYLKTDKREKWD